MKQFTILMFFLNLYLMSYGQIYCNCEDTFDIDIRLINKKVYKLKMSPFQAYPSSSDSLKLENTETFHISEGKIIQNTNLYPNGQLAERCTNVFDTEGNLIENTNYTSKNTIDTKKRYYYENNYLTTIERYDKYSFLFSTTKFEIDSTNYFIKSYEIINDTIIEDINYIELDSLFLPLKKHDISEEGVKKLSIAFVYNKDKNIDSIYTMYYDKSKHTKAKLIYDDLNRLSKKKYFNLYTNEVIGEEVYKYDEYSNIVYSHIFDIYGQNWETNIYTYSYDSKGNWIKKEIWFPNKLAVKERVERTIKYN